MTRRQASKQISRSYSRTKRGARRNLIKSAKKLTRELDGADQIVKKWFFRLPQSRLKLILSAYEEAYGSVPRNYAEKVISQWRKGEVKMSGLVAERLFKLLPRFMPPRLRYKIAERLWVHFSPSSRGTLSIRQDSNSEEVITRIRDCVEGIVMR